MLKVASFFSGGFGSQILALKSLKIDYHEVFACEINKDAVKSYINNHGEPESFYEDITTMDGTKYKGLIDYLHLSPPCQSYSIQGNRKGAKDDRGGLMFEAIKKIDEIQPKMFTIENVKGLLSSNGGQDWRNILSDLRKLNYTISYGVMRADNHGTPQTRQRVMIVGFRAKCMPMAFPLPIQLKTNVLDLLEKDVDEKYFLTDKQIAKYTVDENVKQNKCIVKTNDSTGFKTVNHADCIDLSFPNSTERRGRVQVQKSQTLDTSCNIGVLLEDDVSYKIRRLTPREASRVQGDFEDMFDLGDFSDSKLFFFIGNAIDINTMKALISKILTHSEEITFMDPQPCSFEKSAEKEEITLFDT